MKASSSSSFLGFSSSSRSGRSSQVAAAKNPEYLLHVSQLDRATQGVYPAGSTFKPIVAEAAMQDGLISPSSYLACTGSYTVGTGTWKGHLVTNQHTGFADHVPHGNEDAQCQYQHHAADHNDQERFDGGGEALQGYIHLTFVEAGSLLQ